MIRFGIEPEGDLVLAAERWLEGHLIWSVDSGGSVVMLPACGHDLDDTLGLVVQAAELGSLSPQPTMEESRS